ncbi:MAG: family 43 glycosylhydrolase, partial [Bacteroidota bacterium]
MFNRSILIAFALTFSSICLLGQPDTYQNPIIPGFHPDPSICRAGDDYYLVNSSFEWFPGVPIFHSKDLVNWERIGNVLDRPSQLDIGDNVGIFGGIWAPTIRYHEGTFYMITTMQPGNHNFFVTSKDPKGPWSDPVWLKEAPGIDPTIFFDDDGKTYYVGSYKPENPAWNEERHIFVQELDLKEGKLLGERIHISSGHAANAKFCEGPHIYKRNGKYILLTAEGGTWENHAITAFSADAITGPYTPLTTNPVLTHRHLGKSSSITSVGHADLVETQNGEWWGVMLGVRPVEGPHYYLGRETFMTPVEWEGITPIFSPGKGRILEEDKRPDLPWTPLPKDPQRDEFNSNKLHPVYNFFHTPNKNWWSIDQNKGHLTLELQSKKTNDNSDFSLIARRQEQYSFEASLKMTFSPTKEAESAGIFYGQHAYAHFKLEVSMVKNQQVVQLKKVYKNH